MIDRRDETAPPAPEQVIAPGSNERERVQKPEGLNVAHVFLDLQVLDHLERLVADAYVGSRGRALAAAAEFLRATNVTVWMSEISRVEMLHGQHNPSLSAEKTAAVSEKDRAKLRLAEDFEVRWLAYPASRVGDEYSLVGVSLRCAGPNTAVAIAFEDRIESEPGVSKGDARQLSSFVYGHWDHGNRPSKIGCFVTEDRKLHRALSRLQGGGLLPELDGTRVLSIPEFVEYLPTAMDSP